MTLFFLFGSLTQYARHNRVADNTSCVSRPLLFPLANVSYNQALLP